MSSDDKASGRTGSGDDEEGPRRVVLILSGGLDSSVLLYHLRAEGRDVQALSFDYGQRHARELERAKRICDTTGTPHRIVKLDELATLFAGSGLVDASVEIPPGPYAKENIRITEVPNRNMIMIAIAVTWAKTHGADGVAIAVHGGHHALYADCTPEFVESLAVSVRLATESSVDLVAPFARWTKTDIVRRGDALAVPFAITWSCYLGDVSHCGECGTCQERRDAFVRAGVYDPTPYTPPRPREASDIPVGGPRRV